MAVIYRLRGGYAPGQASSKIREVLLVTMPVIGRMGIVKSWKLSSTCASTVESIPELKVLCTFKVLSVHQIQDPEAELPTSRDQTSRPA